jgi:excisionase family DNA binding protein
MNEQTYSVADAARQLGVKPSAVRKAITRGALASVDVGGALAVTAAELDRYRSESLLRTPERTAERTAYASAIALADGGVGIETIRSTLAPGVLDSARAYARRRRLRWPLPETE